MVLMHVIELFSSGLTAYVKKKNEDRELNRIHFKTS